MSGECLRGEGLVWLIGAVVFASCITRVQLYVNACNWMAAVCGCSAHHWLLPINCHFRDCKARWSGHCISCDENPTFTFTFRLIISLKNAVFGELGSAHYDITDGETRRSIGG